MFLLQHIVLLLGWTCYIPHVILEPPTGSYLKLAKVWYKRAKIRLPTKVWHRQKKKSIKMWHMQKWEDRCLVERLGGNFVCLFVREVHEKKNNIRVRWMPSYWEQEWLKKLYMLNWVMFARWINMFYAETPCMHVNWVCILYIENKIVSDSLSIIMYSEDPYPGNLYSLVSYYSAIKHKQRHVHELMNKNCVNRSINLWGRLNHEYWLVNIDRGIPGEALDKWGGNACDMIIFRFGEYLSIKIEKGAS